MFGQRDDATDAAMRGRRRDLPLVDEAEFNRLIEADEFAEWAYVFDHLYEVPRSPSRKP